MGISKGEFTVKDVRKLHTCCICLHLGIYKPRHTLIDIPIVICIHEKAKVRKAQRSYCHPRCYLEEMGLQKLLGLDIDELGEIRLSDVSPRVMRKILDNLTQHQKN